MRATNELGRNLHGYDSSHRDCVGGHMTREPVTVWTEEPGIRVRFEHEGNGVVVTVIELRAEGETPRLLAHFKLLDFRWRKIVEGMGVK